MGTGEFVLSLVTVFLGAFLAFLVENFRERRQLQRWVRRYLSHIDELLDEAATAMPVVNAYLAGIDDALDAWLTGNDGCPEPDWSVLAGVPASQAPDLLSSLSGEALTVVPPATLAALTRAETAARTVELSCGRLEAVHAAWVMPLVLARRTSLDPAERHGVELFRERLREFAEVTRAGGARLTETLGVLRSHRL